MSQLIAFLKVRHGIEKMKCYLTDHPEQFDEALRVALEDTENVGWNASWMLWHSMKKNDPRILPHVDDFIASLLNRQSGFQREILKILLKMELDENQEGLLFDRCITLWKSIHKQSSVRMISFQYLIAMSKKYPELSPEIDFLTQKQYIDPLSPGIKRSLLKMLRDMGV